MKRSLKQIITRLYSPYKEEKTLFFKNLVYFLSHSIRPIFIVIMIEHITISIENGDKEGLMTNIIIIATWFALYSIFIMVKTKRGWHNFWTRLYKYEYKGYIEKYTNLSNLDVEKLGTGKIISIVEKGFISWSNLLQRSIERGGGLVLSILFAIYVIIRTDIIRFIIFVFLLIGLFLASIPLHRCILKNKRKTRVIINKTVSLRVKIIISKFEILISNNAKKETKNLNENIDKLEKTFEERLLKLETLHRLPKLISVILTIGLYLVIGVGIIDGDYSFADLVLITGMLSVLNSVMDYSTAFFKEILSDYSNIEQLRDFFDDNKTLDNTKGKKFVFKNGTIELKNIKFAYSEGTDVFDDFSLKLEGHKKFAFVGNSGGGKTTLIKLIAGYINPDSGQILIDGQDLGEAKLMDYYKHIGYLTQEPSVFDGSIRDNLMYAINDSDKKQKEKELDKVITDSRCEFIRDFKDGLDTQIGERGVRLSGGQKQRLAIAKIMLKNPDIILLDEPTSALDSVSEQKVAQALHNLFNGKTVLVVAHRLQTVKEADKIFVIDDGKIIQEGTHNILSKKKGKYKDMLDLQTSF